MVSIEESGAAEYSGPTWGRDRRDEAEFEPIEVGDRSEPLSEWIAAEDIDLKPGTLPIKDGEVSPPGAFDHLAPDEVSFHKATVNEGASFKRNCRCAALVLWPKRLRLAVINQSGLTATLPCLVGLIEQVEERGSGRNAPEWPWRMSFPAI